MPERLTLAGCAPTPLAAYLKALGVLRLISSPAHNVSGRAADPEARGWWADEAFHLSTSLDREALRRFFLEDYAPTPIIAPWNGGSGFYPKDNRDGLDPLAADAVSPRFRTLSETIRSAATVIGNLGLRERPSGELKQKLIARLRAQLADAFLPWMDAALALSGERVRYPPLLGTGGNDGRLDFTNNFLGRLVSRKTSKLGLFDAETGSARGEAAGLLDAAVFDAPSQHLMKAAIGQFAPGNAGGANATTGYERDSALNPWDFVLMLEGSVSFAGAATRRHERQRGVSGSFPFTVRATSAGVGAVEVADEDDARAEFWAPLWLRPATGTEIEALFAEGRAVLDGKTASDGLDFARATASLGVSRGFSEFQRYGFLKRAGNQYLAAPLQRRTARPSPGAELGADLDAYGWLARLRRISRAKGAPAAGRSAVKHLEDALLDLVGAEVTPQRVEAALGSLGSVVRWIASSKKNRDEIGAPPGLSRHWLRYADDGTSEVRVAAALAGLGSRGTLRSSGPGKEQPHEAPPMAAHWAPIDERTFPYRKRRWSATPGSPTVVWGPGSLIHNLRAVLDRRIVEASVRDLRDKPLGSSVAARLADVADFLAGSFDDARCARLLAGLVWMRPDSFIWTRGPGADDKRRELPFAYAALKPIFSTDGALRRVRALPTGATMPIPPGTIARLARGGTDHARCVAETVRSALARARGSGLASPFDAPASLASLKALGGRLRADRLAAALLIPINDYALTSLLQRAYSLPKEDMDHGS